MTREPQTHLDAIRSIERLHRILEAAKLLNSTLDLAELTAIILRIVHDEVGTDRGTVFVLERDRRGLHSFVGQGGGGEGLIVPAGKRIAGTVAPTGGIINISKSYAGLRFCFS